MKKLLFFAALSAAVSAFAGFSIKELPRTNGAVLEHGYIYNLSESLSLTGADGKSALSVPANARVGIYIPKDVTLDLRGGDGYLRTPGAPGLHVPKGSTVYLMGEGVVNATGGNAGGGSDGKKGGNATKSGNVYTSGYGAEGGAGGGGAAPGIGGMGGEGGAATTKVSGLTATWGAEDFAKSGAHGCTGNAGADGEDSGDIIVLGLLTVNTIGGNNDSAAVGKWGGDEGESIQQKDGALTLYVACGGGSGAGGGNGTKATGVGGGAGGGGSGGSGGSGALTSSVLAGYLPGGFGQGGRGGKQGEPASSKWYVSALTSLTGGEGGDAGSRGKIGASYVYKYKTATLTRTYGSDTTPQINSSDGEYEDIALPLHFDNNGGATSDDAAVYCCGPVQKKIEIPNHPSALPSGKDIYVFDGYFDADGVQYYDEKGERVNDSEWMSLEGRTLIAKWHVEYAPCRLMLFDDVSIEVPYMAEELPTLEKDRIPTRVGYQFAGFEDANGVQFYDAKGEMVEAEREIIDDMRLVAKWTPNQYKATLACGFEGEGAYSTGSTTVSYEQIPGKLRVPVREGYSFLGYFDEEGNMYFNAEGKGVAPYTILGDIALIARWAPLPEIIDPVSIRQRWPWNGEFEVTYKADHLRPERNYSLIVEFSVVEIGASEPVLRRVAFPIESKNGTITVVVNMASVIAEETLDETASVRLRLVLNKVEAE